MEHATAAPSGPCQGRALRGAPLKKLLSLPPNLVGSFHEVTGLSRDGFFCTCDPIGRRLGSGGGTTWLLQEAFRSAEKAADGQSPRSFDEEPRQLKVMVLPLPGGEFSHLTLSAQGLQISRS